MMFEFLIYAALIGFIGHYVHILVYGTNSSSQVFYTKSGWKGLHGAEFKHYLWCIALLEIPRHLVVALYCQHNLSLIVGSSFCYWTVFHIGMLEACFTDSR